MNNTKYKIVQYPNKPGRWIVEEHFSDNTTKLHTANDYGFSSKHAAHKFIAYKENIPKYKKQKEEIKSWWNDRKAAENYIDDEIFISECKDHMPFTKKDFINCLNMFGISENEVPYDWKLMLKLR